MYMYINNRMNTILTISFSVLEDFLLRTIVPSSEEFLRSSSSASVVVVMMEGTGGTGATGAGGGGTWAGACMGMGYVIVERNKITVICCDCNVVCCHGD